MLAESVSDDVFKKKMFNGEIMSHSSFSKVTEKVVLLELEGLIEIIVRIRLQKFCFYQQAFFEGYEISIKKTIVLI